MAADYYETLGIGPDASDDEIKRAYRQLARENHPDANPDDAMAGERFKEVAEAYSVLSDPVKRRDYDLFGSTRVPSGGFDAFDIFRSFFGSDPFSSYTAQRRGPQRGSDLILEIQVRLEEVVAGTTKSVTIRNLQPCDTCGGNGCAPGTSPTRCSRCGGSGAVRSVQRSLFGNLMTSFTCPQCHGEGQEIASPCEECNGDGRLERLDEISVEVPAGVDDGTQLRISGRGQAGARGGGSGDLFVQVRVLPHDRFLRRGNDLLTTLTLPFTQAALGTTLGVDTFDGPVEVPVPAGTQPADTIRVKGKGIPRYGRAGRGDLIFEVQVQVPEHLSTEQEDLVRKLAESRGEGVDPAGLVRKIRGAFRS